MQMKKELALNRCDLCGSRFQRFGFLGDVYPGLRAARCTPGFNRARFQRGCRGGCPAPGYNMASFQRESTRSGRGSAGGMSVAFGERKIEGGAEVWFTFSPGAAAMALDDAPDVGKADAGSFEFGTRM